MSMTSTRWRKYFLSTSPAASAARCATSTSCSVATSPTAAAPGPPTPAAVEALTDPIAGRPRARTTADGADEAAGRRRRRERGLGFAETGPGRGEAGGRVVVEEESIGDGEVAAVGNGV